MTNDQLTTIWCALNCAADAEPQKIKIVDVMLAIERVTGRRAINEAGKAFDFDENNIAKALKKIGRVKSP